MKEINIFLESLPSVKRDIFVGRYWYADGIQTLAKRFSWFLAEDLTDFSQVLTEQVIYVVPGSMEGISGSPQDGAYSLYSLDENGETQWGIGRSAPQNPIRQMVPYEFSWLTDEIIREDLAGVDYEDYIIAESTRLYTVFVWVRCADGEDMFVTYPARPEFVGLENRGRYTLAEVQ